MPTIEQPPGHWSLSLPRKREASGALFFDDHGRVLTVKPTYVEGWDYPGGVVEAEEAPYAAACRDIGEEIGLTKRLGRLIAVDWEPRTTDIPIEGLMTIFDAASSRPRRFIRFACRQPSWRPTNSARSTNLLSGCRRCTPDGSVRRPRRERAGIVAYLENEFPVPAAG